LQTLLPTKVDHVLSNRRLVTASRRLACWRGSTFEDEGQILDGNGDPVQLSDAEDEPSPWWEFLAQVRDAPKQQGGQVLATFSVEVLDGVAGTVRYRLVAGDTGSIDVEQAFWDLDMTNVSNPNYDVGFVATPFQGAFHFLGHYSNE
jgi:hypothetical protein